MTATTPDAQAGACLRVGPGPGRARHPHPSCPLVSPRALQPPRVTGLAGLAGWVRVEQLRAPAPVDPQEGGCAEYVPGVSEEGDSW